MALKKVALSNAVTGETPRMLAAFLPPRMNLKTLFIIGLAHAKFLRLARQKPKKKKKAKKRIINIFCCATCTCSDNVLEPRLSIV